MEFSSPTKLHLEDGLPGLVSSNYGWSLKSPRPRVVGPLPNGRTLHGWVHGGVILTTLLTYLSWDGPTLPIPNHPNLGTISKHARQPSTHPAVSCLSSVAYGYPHNFWPAIPSETENAKGSKLCGQPMVSWWFGARWFGILGYPQVTIPDSFSGSQRFQTTRHQTTKWPSADKLLRTKKTFPTRLRNWRDLLLMFSVRIPKGVEKKKGEFHKSGLEKWCPWKIWAAGKWFPWKKGESICHIFYINPSIFNGS